MKKSYFICFYFFLCCTVHQTEKAPYDADLPLLQSIEFSDGNITTSNGICFSKHGFDLYTSKSIDSKFENGKKLAGLFKHTFENGAWSEPIQVDLGLDLDAYHPVLSPDNDLLYFNSRSDLQMPGTAVPHNIWSSRRTPNGWSQPHMISAINSEHYDSYPSVARNGNLYFNSDRPGGKGGMDIYVSYFLNDQFQKPINLGVINSVDAENDLVVDPDERFIIFNRYLAATNEIDLFISKRLNGVWIAPRALTEINQPGKWELTPSLSPNGKYFFYELDQKIRQIDIGVLTEED